MLVVDFTWYLPVEHAGPEAVEDGVGARAERVGEREPRLVFRSQTTDSLPALTASCQAGAVGRIGSPCGGSTWTTRAPSREQLAARERPRQVPGEVDDEHARRAVAPPSYYGRALTDRSIAQEEKRRLILDAAVRVFARSGLPRCRVGDITEEAGVAHGLLYHYFKSKDEVLEAVFRDAWGDVLEAFRGIEESDESPREQLGHVAAILLRSWRRDPDLVRVLVREIGRSPQVQTKVDELGQAFTSIERIVARGQARGRLPLRPRRRGSLAWIFYGGIEEILTGWVLGQLPDGDEDVARAERTVVDVVCEGMAVAVRRANLVRNLGLGAFGLAFSITTTAAYLPPLLAQVHRPGTLIGLVLGAEGVFALCVPPVIGPWSDTFQTPMGRRRPFMLAALGPIGFCLADLMPFMPNIWTTMPDRARVLLRVLRVRAARTVACTPTSCRESPRPGAGRAAHLRGARPSCSRWSAAGFCSRSGARPRSSSPRW